MTHRQTPAGWRCVRWLAALGALLFFGAAGAQPEPDPQRVIVAVHESPEPRAAAGGLPRLRYLGAPQYGGSARAAGRVEAVAREHGLVAEARWSILPLELLCVQLRLPAGSDRAGLMARLQADPRVALVQPLNEFEALADPAPPAAAAALGGLATRPTLPGFDDPYSALQHGFVAIGAPAAQRAGDGAGVRVAVVDTGVDAGHPDLAGRIAMQRDFVGAAGPAPASGGERHGTEVAGVIAAVAHNRIGIAGIAPRARLLAYRACWPVAAGGARCNSFTLAQALAAAIADGAQVLNLSLGGPADPLLERLLREAQGRGIAVVAALPRSGRREGFPAGVAGVLAVGVAEDAAPAAAVGGAVLRAPGRDILTLQPEGGFGYASGSSLAAAHASGALALLRSLEPKLAVHEAERWWQAGDGVAAALDLCRAVQRLRPGHRCD
jgi:subtilisin family serine protease